MEKQKICQKLAQTTYRVKAYESGELYSEGTGFCFNDQGSLITAAHVLDKGNPFKEGEIKNRNIVFKAHRKTERPVTFQINLCGIKINWPDGPIKNPIIIDLAILSPATSKQNVPHLNIGNDKCVVGSEVIMAGFPDEIEFPLKLDKNIDRKYLKNKQDEREIEQNMDQLQAMLLMQKAGMIAFTDSIVIDPKLGDNFKLVVGVNYIDNAMHSGASGGPVVNEHCEVIGVISKRAVTRISPTDRKIPSHEVPSGSTLSVSPKTIIDYIQYQISRNNFSY